VARRRRTRDRHAGVLLWLLAVVSGVDVCRAGGGPLLGVAAGWAVWWVGCRLPWL
jgi:hypothetical protein